MDLFSLGPSKVDKKFNYDCIFAPVPKFAKSLGFDTETHLITSYVPVPTLVCITFSDKTIYGGSTEDKLRGIGKLIKALEDSDTYIVGHNVFFDLLVVMEFLLSLGLVTTRHELEKYFWEKIRAGKIRDTGVLARLIAIRYDWLRFDPITQAPAEFSLEVLMKRHLNITLTGKKGEDVWRLRYKELDGIPIEMWPGPAKTYAIDDAVYAEMLYTFLVNKFGNGPDEIFQVESGWVLHKMSVWGILPDVETARELENRVGPLVDNSRKILIEKGYLRQGEIKVNRQKIKDLVKAALGDKTPTTASGDVSLSEGAIRAAIKASKNALLKAYLNNKDDKELLLELGLAEELEPTKDMEAIRKAVKEHFGSDAPLTDKGQISTDRGTIEAVPELKELAEIGEFEKIVSTYLPIFKEGHVLHARWNGLVASGRVSVSNPNLNNIPRDHGVRECFKARPGFVLVSADYAQAELCSLAQICLDKFGYSHMADAINAGKDLHLLLVSQLLSLPYEEVYSRHKAGDTVIKDMRQLAKAANFGFPGGLGPDTFISFAYESYKVVISREEAQKLKAVWLTTYPEVNEYFKWISKKLSGKKQFDYVQHRSGRIRGRVGYCDGCNTGFQGLTADGAKYAKNSISYAMYCDPASPLFGSHIVAFIYDELLIEVPEDRLHEAAMELQRLMISGMQVFTPGVITRVEVDAMYHWSKKSKTVYENGRLVPFDKDKYGPNRQTNTS